MKSANEKKRIGGYILMLVGVLLLAGAAMLIFNNRREEEAAQITADMAVHVLRESVIPQNSNGNTSAQINKLTTTVRQMQSVVIDEHEYIGLLEYPALGLSLPVLSGWSDDLLKVSPCRYKGSVLENNMILAGHNYKRHFGMLAQAQLGDAVTFTGVLGDVYHFTVVELETIDGSDTSAMLEGDWALTLFTCTPGGKARVTARCA
ncbi:sortase [Eubacteriales bacterium OttesenSCG-928-K08]|nr:sortase [Eubacteriales bacterium OttesenSCG-928-K08]